MSNFTTRTGIEIYYDDEGAGPPVIMLHGFGMSAKTCWGQNDWYSLLNQNGFRAIAMDSRGHGSSSKLTDPAQYDASLMKADVLALMDHLGLPQAHFVGHSMGARTVLDIMIQNPDRVFGAVLVSVGENVFTSPDTRPLANAFKTGSVEGLPAPITGFVNLLLALGNDPDALAAYCANPRPAMTPDNVARINLPVEVACGESDFLVGNASVLAEALGRGNLTLIKGCEHTDVLNSIELKKISIEFLLQN